MSKETIENKSLQIKFPERVLIKWVKHRDVINYLAACDYGILLREQSYTNKVASPTKFAEYLFAGLQVLISKDLGDFSEFVKLNHCGIILSEEKGLEHPLNKTSTSQKEYCHILAQNNFTKDAKASSVDKIREKKDTTLVGSGAIFKAMNSTVTMNLSTLFKLTGVNFTISAACASGSHAIGMAYQLIKSGLQDIVICGGAQEINKYADT